MCSEISISISEHDLLAPFHSLRNRFIRSQEDCVFTSQALVPTFGCQVLESLDVEGLTLKIQQFGKEPPMSRPDLLSTGSVISEGSAPSVPPSEAPSSPAASDPILPAPDMSQSWAEEFAATRASLPENLPLPPATPSEGSPQSSYVGLRLADSGLAVDVGSENGDMVSDFAELANPSH